jgi:pimeloyl-ACP methyl ester carboxylesterase
MPAVMGQVFIETIVSQGYRVVHFAIAIRVGRRARRCAGAEYSEGDHARFAATRYMPYDLTDMARDAVGVLDAVGVDKAHVVGVSMGGMIAQMLAAQYPERVRSLTSIMSSTGNPRPRVALGKRRALKALLRRPPPGASIDGIVDHLVHVFGVIAAQVSHRLPRSLRPISNALRVAGSTPMAVAATSGNLATGDRRSCSVRSPRPRSSSRR